MPRRRYRRDYGGGCCGCCRYWNQDEEEIAQQYIKTRAKNSLLGKVICCDCDRGYERHNVKRLYIFAGVAFGIMVLVTLGYSGNVYEPARYISSFKKTNCKVVEVEFSDNITSSCRYEASRSDKGWREYKCLRVHVSYRTKDKVNGNSTKYTTILAEGYKHLKKSGQSVQCTSKPSTCNKYNDLDFESRRLARYYKDTIGDSEFECLYNPKLPDEVVTMEVHDLSKARSTIVLLALLATVLGLLLFFMCCTCGCQYVCADRVPLEIQQEVQKRRAENQGLTAGDPALAGGGPNIYVGQPMQLVPMAGGAAQPLIPGPQPQPLQPMQPMHPAQLPTGPQYGQYPPAQPVHNYPVPQPGYPAPMPGQYPPQQPGYAPPPAQYPPQQPVYPPQAQPGPPPDYTPAAAPPVGGAPTAPPPAQPSAPGAGGGYQPPQYIGINAEAGELPPKPPVV